MLSLSADTVSSILGNTVEEAAGESNNLKKKRRGRKRKKPDGSERADMARGTPSSGGKYADRLVLDSCATGHRSPLPNRPRSKTKCNLEIKASKN